LKWWNRSRISVFLTLVIACTTITYAFFSYQQWQTMRQQLELSERPWVGPFADATVKRALTRGQSMLAELCVTNTGHSPGLDINISPGFMIPGEPPTQFGVLPKWLNNSNCAQESEMDQSIPQGPNVTVIGRGFLTIFPNSRLCFDAPSTIPVTGDATSDARVDRVLTGTDTLYLSGCIIYDDTLGKHHWTSFCQDYDLKSGTFRICPIHNSTDKN
jgi:hypothetical protein